MPEIYQGIDCKSPRKKDLTLRGYCAACQKSFLSKAFYTIHLDKSHGIEQPKTLKLLTSTDDPDVNDPKNHCTSRDKTYTSKTNYRCHLNEVHNLILPPSTQRRVKASNIKPVVDGLKNYYNVCNRVYKTMEFYRTQMFKYYHITIRPAKVLSIRVNRNEIPVIDKIGTHCTVCDKIYRGRASYRVHMYEILGIVLPKFKGITKKINHSIIPDREDKNNHCDSCNRTYSSRTEYLRHLVRIQDMKTQD
ncbi:hypothetical protein EDC94DRAFT_657315 [Helicostylum pulchrum]|nr:hypothetical protein EDC94DRAFT_657315 [Helicostylum pulchrum]